MNLDDLAKPFPPKRVSWRVGTTFEKDGATHGLALAYVDARDVMERLDKCVGPEGWQDDYAETPNGRIICRIGIDVGNGWVWKSDGAGNTAYEGEKGAISDAFKRAAVKWGVGRYLYDLPKVYANNLVKRGKNWALPKDFDGGKYLPTVMSEKEARLIAKLVDEGNPETGEGVDAFGEAWLEMNQDEQMSYGPWVPQFYPGGVSAHKQKMRDLVAAYRNRKNIEEEA